MAYATPDDLAELIRRKRQWVIRECSAGRLPHQRVGKYIRFTPKQVEQIEQAMERDVRDDNGGRIPGFSPRSRSKYAKAPPA